MHNNFPHTGSGILPERHQGKSCKNDARRMHSEIAFAAERQCDESQRHRRTNTQLPILQSKTQESRTGGQSCATTGYLSVTRFLPVEAETTHRTKAHKKSLRATKAMRDRRRLQGGAGTPQSQLQFAGAALRLSCCGQAASASGLTTPLGRSVLQRQRVLVPPPAYQKMRR